MIRDREQPGVYEPIDEMKWNSAAHDLRNTVHFKFSQRSEYHTAAVDSETLAHKVPLHISYMPTYYSSNNKNLESGVCLTRSLFFLLRPPFWTDRYLTLSRYTKSCTWSLASFLLPFLLLSFLPPWQLLLYAYQTNDRFAFLCIHTVTVPNLYLG